MHTDTMFPLGSLIISPAAYELLDQQNISPDSLFERHALGDWGDVTDSDKKANDLAIEMGGRILSSYMLPNAERVWVTTDPERTATTILLPCEH